MVYFTQETQQRWGPPLGAGSEDGAMLWLPGGVFLELRMVSAVRRPPRPMPELLLKPLRLAFMVCVLLLVPCYVLLLMLRHAKGTRC